MNWYGNFGTLPSNGTKKKLNEFKERIEIQNFYNWLVNLAVNEFKTEGLPETMDRHFIEYCFLFRGMVTARDLFGKPFSMSANPYDTLTVFGKPARGESITLDGKNYDSVYYWEYLHNEETSNAVLGFDNEQGYPFINYIIDRAERLGDAFRAIDTASKLCKLSGVVKIPEEQINSVKAILTDYNNNLPFLLIPTRKGGLPMDLDVLNFNSNSGIIKDLWDNYNNLKAETLSMFGINLNSNSDKKERMTQIEVVGDVNLPTLTAEARLEKRKEFYDLVNKKFGTNITVKLNYENPEPAQDLAQNKEDLNNAEDETI